MAALTAAAMATAQAQAAVAAKAAAAAKELAATEAAEESARSASKALAAGAEARSIVKEVAPEVAILVASVPDADLVKLFKLLASNLKVLDSEVEWDNWGVLPMVCSRVVSSLDNARVTAAEALARATFSGSELGRVAFAVSSLERSGSTRYANADSAGDGDAVRSAAQRIADDHTALAAVLEAAKLARSDASEGDSLPLLRAKVGAMELGPFGADVALLLHQEKLAASPSGASSAAQRVLEKVREVRTGLASARLALWRRVVPDGISLADMIAAVNCGKITSSVLIGKNPAGGASAALSRVWPLLVAMVRQLWPRDTEVEYTLLRMARELFVVGKASDHAVSVVVDGVFAEYASRCGSWLRGIGPAPSLAKAHEHVLLEASKEASLSQAVGGQPKQQRSEAEKAAAAAAAKAAKEAREAAANEGAPLSNRAKKAAKKAEEAAAAAAKAAEEAAAKATAAATAPAAAGGEALPAAGRGRGAGAGGKG